jgi:MOSC domain-containing protein YiiM/transcriptional antiterminator Rof (Rho-off)
MSDMIDPPMVGLRVASLRVGKPRSVTGSGSGPAAEPFESAILKTPVTGPVAISRIGLSGDAQANTQHHGGSDKAICVYPSVHYGTWREELGPLGAAAGDGAFGENLTVEGADEALVAIGDHFAAPSGLVVQISQPRVPCWKLARRWGVADFAAQVIATDRTGWYCRVLTEGALEVGDVLRRTAHPHPTWAVARANQVYHAVSEHMEEALSLAELPALSAASRASLYRKLESTGYTPMACAVHDLLEDAAVRRVPLNLELRLPSGGSEGHVAHVRDLRTELGAEYVELSTSRLVRLDRVLRVDPVDSTL